MKPIAPVVVATIFTHYPLIIFREMRFMTCKFFMFMKWFMHDAYSNSLLSVLKYWCVSHLNMMLIIASLRQSVIALIYIYETNWTHVLSWYNSMKALVYDYMSSTSTFRALPAEGSFTPNVKLNKIRVLRNFLIQES